MKWCIPQKIQETPVPKASNQDFDSSVLNKQCEKIDRAGSRWEMKTFGWAVWFFSCREAAEAEKKINLQHPGPVSCWLLSPACVGVATGLGGHWAPSDAVQWGLKATTERLCLRDRKEFYELNCTVRKEKGKFRAPFIPRSWKFKKKGFLLKALFKASQ